MSEEIKVLQDEFQKTAKVFKEANDQHDAELKKYGTAAQEIVNKVDTLNARLDTVETKMNRPPMVEKSGPSESKEAFLNFLRKGDKPQEIKAAGTTFATGSDTIGGYTVPHEFYQQLFYTSLNEVSPIRQVAKVIKTNSHSISIQSVSNFATAAWATDEATTARTSLNVDVPFGQITLTPYSAYATVTFSNDLLADSAFDLEAEMLANVRDKIAALEGLAFVHGDGTGEPTGIIESPTDAYVVHTGVADNWTATNPGDKLWDVMALLKEYYIGRSKWLMKRSTMHGLRKFKSSDGQYIWQPGFGSQPNTLLGYPVVLVPDWDAVGANKYIVGFGDWEAHYIIADRQGMTVLRDPYSLATKNTVQFIFQYRVDGEPNVVEAAAFLRCEA